MCMCIKFVIQAPKQKNAHIFSCSDGKQNFHGIVRDYPSTIPAFPEISLEFCLCVSFFPQEKHNT